MGNLGPARLKVRNQFPGAGELRIGAGNVQRDCGRAIAGEPLVEHARHGAGAPDSVAASMSMTARRATSPSSGKARAVARNVAWGIWG
jgi:hypothetical protein